MTRAPRPAQALVRLAAALALAAHAGTPIRAAAEVAKVRSPADREEASALIRRCMAEYGGSARGCGSAG